jgi:hypothetical protein
MTIQTITPRQQIRNVQACLERARGSRPYRGRAWVIRSSRAQLAEMWVQYRRGELRPKTDKLPF